MEIIDKRLKSLMQDVPVIMYQYKVDHAGNHSMPYLSEGASYLLGEESSHFVQNADNFFKKLHPEDSICFKEKIDPNQSALNSFSSALRIIDNSGETQFWVRNSVTPEVLENGSIIWNGIIVDITEFKQAEAVAKKSEQDFRNIIETAQEGIWTLDENDRTNFVNQKMCEIMEYSYSEMMGRELFDFMDEEGKKHAITCMERRRTGVRENLEIRYITKSGRRIWASIAANPIFDEGVYKGSLAMVTDITDKKIAEEIMELQNKELMKTNSELDRFVYSASHELRSPLTSILGLINILKAEEEDYDKTQLLELIETSAENLDLFITDIINYSRNSRLNVEFEKIDFKKMFSQSLEGFNYIYGASKLEYNLEIKEQSDFYSDKKRIAIVLNNLISNAIKYRNNELSIQYLNLIVDLRKDAAYLEFRDNGVGISSRHIENVFDMFYRGTSKKTGAGLGLYIVKEIIEKLSGTIRIESVEGEGTSVFVMVPNEKRK